MCDYLQVRHDYINISWTKLGDCDIYWQNHVALRIQSVIEHVIILPGCDDDVMIVSLLMPSFVWWSTTILMTLIVPLPIYSMLSSRWYLRAMWWYHWFVRWWFLVVGAISSEINTIIQCSSSVLHIRLINPHTL